jgi:hypothetical protein
MKIKLFNKKAVTGLMVIPLFALLVLPLVSPTVANADTANTTVAVDVGSVISAFTTSGTVTLGALTPDTTGKQSINKDIVTVNTNSPTGFTLSLKDADTTYALTSGANSIPATSGTPAAPIALINNTWGIRVDGLLGFGTGPTTVTSNTAPSAATFAAIPANGTPLTINSTSATGSTITNVWYSARVNSAQASGTYNDIVTYTATVN